MQSVKSVFYYSICIAEKRSRAFFLEIHIMTQSLIDIVQQLTDLQTKIGQAGDYL